MATSHWIDPERVFDKVVALTDDAVYVASPSSEQAAAMKQALEAGEPASTVVKDDVTAILVTAIASISYNAHESDIDIDYKSGKEKESKNIDFSTPAERNEFAIQLGELLPDFEGKVKEYSRIRAALWPLGFGAVVGVLTMAFYYAAIDIAAGASVEIEGRRRAVKQLVFTVIEFVGPIGVLIMGGLMLFGAGFMLAHRVHTPPIMHTLKRVKA